MQVCKPNNHFYLDLEENNRPSDCKCSTKADETVTYPTDETVTYTADETVTCPADETVTYTADETVTYTADETVTYTADEIVDTNEQLTTDNPDAFSDNREVNF